MKMAFDGESTQRYQTFYYTPQGGKRYYREPERNQSAIDSYRMKRENGDEQDNPNYPFPEDGEFAWYGFGDITKVLYTPGEGDKLWMTQKDRNYVFRLEEQGTLDKTERHLQHDRPELYAELMAARQKAKQEEALRLTMEKGNNHFQLTQYIEKIGELPSEPGVITSPDLNIEIPPDLCCPITLLLMFDPVKTTNKQTYEREAITEWLKSHTTDPNTRASATTLTSDNEKKQEIRKYLIKYPFIAHSTLIYLPKQHLIDFRAALLHQGIDKMKTLISINRSILMHFLAPQRTAFHIAAEIGTKEILSMILSHLTPDEKEAMIHQHPDNWRPIILKQLLTEPNTKHPDIKLSQLKSGPLFKITPVSQTQSLPTSPGPSPRPCISHPLQ